ncbi:MAG: hypothetical protein KAU14_03900, partial [Thermoplasmata archaeon]|nr:hypothetical protein [Thermoplasmata archaeon]
MALMKDLIARLAEMGILASPGAIRLLSSNNEPLAIVKDILAGRGELLYLEEEDVAEALRTHPEELEEEEKSEEVPIIGGVGNPSLEAASEGGEAISLTKPMIPLRGVDRYRPIASEYEDDVVVEGDVTGHSLCEGKISDFSRYFADRFNRLRDLIKTRPEMMHTLPIYKAKSRSGKVAVIGIVSRVISTDKGLSVEIEDEEDSISVYISKGSNSRLLKEVGTIIHDEVIGVLGRVKQGRAGRGPSIYPDSIIRPPLPFRHSPNLAEEEISAALVSDLHIGSKTFLEKEWKKAIDFLNGRHYETREVASRIKYLVFPGD